MGNLRDRVGGWPAPRWFPVVALVVGVGFMIQRLTVGDSVYGAFLRGCGAALAVMIVLGFAHRQVRGDRLNTAQGPGGIGGGFEDAGAAEKTREAVAGLNERVTKLNEQLIGVQTQLDRRLTDLETEVFKRTTGSSEIGDGA